MDISLVLALLSGVAIAAATGLRAFLPLFLIGIAGRFELIGLNENVEWLTSTYVLVALGVATVVEIAGDKIPAVDHALDVVATVVRPVAAWIAAYSMLIHWPSPWAQVVATLLAGGSLAIHAFKSVFRLGTTSATAGAANPFVSTAEDALSITLVVLAVLLPVAAVLLIVIAIAALRRRRRQAAPA